MEGGGERPLRYGDFIVVAPYNVHVRCLRETLPEAVRVGTVDKFQGQEATVSFFSMASSSGEEVPRGLDFLFSSNRLNVAVSRARCLAYVVASPRLLEADCRPSSRCGSSMRCAASSSCRRKVGEKDGSEARSTRRARSPAFGPCFGRLLERDPLGQEWLVPLLRATPHWHHVPANVLEDPGDLLDAVVTTRPYFDRVLRKSIDLPGGFEFPTRPSREFPFAG